MLMQLGVTALMITAWVGDEAIFNLLVEHNADVTKKADVSFIWEISCFVVVHVIVDLCVSCVCVVIVGVRVVLFY